MSGILAARVFNVPLLVSESYLDSVSQFMKARIEGRDVDIDYKPTQKDSERKFYAMQEGAASFSVEPAKSEEKSVAVIPVMGTMLSRATILDTLSSSGRGYDAIKNEVNASLRDDSIGGGLLHIDTSGGEAARNFELARFIRKIQQDTDKPIWAVVDEAAYSAGYSLASAAERIVTTESGGVGSIGVRVAHVSREKMLKKQGVEVTLITAGKYKGDGNPFTKLDKSSRDTIQAEIDHTYQQFSQLVADHRGLTVADVKATEAATFNATDAMKHGLIDSVMTVDDAFAEFYEHVNSSAGSIYSGSDISAPDATDGSAVNQPESNPMTKTVNDNEAELAQAKAEATEATAKLEAMEAMISHPNATMENMKRCQALGLNAEQVATFMAGETKPAAAPEVLEISSEGESKTEGLLSQLLEKMNTTELNSVPGSSEPQEPKAKTESAQERYKRIAEGL